MPDNFIGKVWIIFCWYVLLPLKYYWIYILLAVIVGILIGIYPALDKAIVWAMIDAGWR
jgi:hypothetical protein